MPTSETAVKITHLNKHFENLKVLDDVSIDIKKGEFVSVIGVSGCGKSTMLRIIGGLETPSSGEVLVYGKIAAVSAKGVVKAKKKGTVKITIYTLPTVKYKSAKKIVTVKVN